MARVRSSLFLLRQVRMIQAPGCPSVSADVLIDGNRIAAIDTPEAGLGEIPTLEASHLWLAPALVDPHSVLEDPHQGRAETLASLRDAAAQGGYGTVALLPWADSWRDRPERLSLSWAEPMRLRLWGSFSAEGSDRELAVHADQLDSGAIGLAGRDTIPPMALLERGLRLGEMGPHPVLMPARDASLSQEGFVRERVEALRAGWPLDPPISESLALQSLLVLAADQPTVALRLMNISTAEGVKMLRHAPSPPPASVSWWHLVRDSGRLDPVEDGWRVSPSLGGPGDREALIAALCEGLITAVAIHHLPLDSEEQLLPVDQRRAGLAGHGVALSMLWQELVGDRGWSPEQLWEALCWGPARFLGLEQETLEPGSRRWLLFDPEIQWSWGASTCASRAANQPCWDRRLQGAVVASGLIDPIRWWVREDRSP